jgi:hypothetical protein
MLWPNTAYGELRAGINSSISSLITAVLFVNGSSASKLYRPGSLTGQTRATALSALAQQ